MRDLMASMHLFDDFLIYLVLSLALLAAFSWLYDKVTPYNELELIREGNTAASIAYSGAVIGMRCRWPAPSRTASTRRHADLGRVRAGGAGARVLPVRRLLPQLNDHIPENRRRPRCCSRRMSLAAGILNAACLTT
jgi:putative membrane protein